MSKRATLTFAVPAGGKTSLRVRLAQTELVSIYARGSIPRLIMRAVRNAKRRGLKLGTCLRIKRGKHVLFDYQLDNGGLA
jgi:hypothetical protein